VATQVCWYWRSTLVSSSSLWTCFQFQKESRHDIDRTLTYLERSKSAPIDVRIVKNYWKGNLDVLEYLAPHIARTRSLAIQTSHMDDAYTASLLFCNPAPLLQHLEIFSASEVVAPLPDNFLGQRAPSLRSVNFVHMCPTLESLFPLPNLTEFHLSLGPATPFRVGALFRFLSESPLLQKIQINVHNWSVQDVSLDKVISLESLVELDCGCNRTGQIIPFLRLPRLKRLQVTSLGLEQAQTLADVLPYGGRALLAGVTKMFYDSDPYTHSHRIELSGNGVDMSLRAFGAVANATLVDWSPDQTWIPFGQIEDLEFERGPPIGHPIDISAFENLRILRVVLRDEEPTNGLFRSLHPGPGASGVPCRSLQEIEAKVAPRGSQGPFPRLLVSLVRERERAGYRLESVSLVVEYWGPRCASPPEELRKHVGEVRIRAYVEGVLVAVSVLPRAPTGHPLAIDIHDKPQTTAYRLCVLQ